MGGCRLVARGGRCECCNSRVFRCAAAAGCAGPAALRCHSLDALPLALPPPAPSPDRSSLLPLSTSPPAQPTVDKRLDEWVNQERVASLAKVSSADGLHRVASGGGSGDLGPLGGGDHQKMTRRLKRQYTEIHHVPAALEELPPIDQVCAHACLLEGWEGCLCVAGLVGGLQVRRLPPPLLSPAFPALMHSCLPTLLRAALPPAPPIMARLCLLSLQRVCLFVDRGPASLCIPLQHLEKEHQEKTKVKNIQGVELGRHEMDTWYYSPYPEPHASCHKLYICEYTLKVGEGWCGSMPVVRVGGTVGAGGGGR